MRIFSAAAMIALLAGPVYAQEQQAPMPRYGDLGKPKTPQEIQQERETDQAYKKSLGNIPDKGPVDPWGNARSTDAPKTVDKTAAKAAPVKPRNKTGSPAN
jgi:hypothetical protein